MFLCRFCSQEVARDQVTSHLMMHTANYQTLVSFVISHREIVEAVSFLGVRGATPQDVTAWVQMLCSLVRVIGLQDERK